MRERRRGENIKTSNSGRPIPYRNEQQKREKGGLEEEQRRRRQRKEENLKKKKSKRIFLHESESCKKAKKN